MIKKPSTVVGEARRAQLVGTFGVGSMFPAPDQSLMICGLEHWYEDRCPEIAEPRLAQSLGVRTLRAPSAGRTTGDVPVIRFPRDYFCPECRRLDQYARFVDSSRPSPFCVTCGIQAVPSRFIAACESGHVQDFPYRAWVHSNSAAGSCKGGKLSLKTLGQTSSLADIEVLCSCGESRSMEDAFSFSALARVSRCQGRRPWLPGEENQQCSEALRTIQRGGSSAWFGNVASAISIPPWSGLHNALNRHWATVSAISDENALRVLLEALDILPTGWTVDRALDVIKTMKNPARLTQEQLRVQELEALLTGHEEQDPSDQFVCEIVNIDDPELAKYVTEIRDVSRLREVRALLSFSRLSPKPDGHEQSMPLSATPQDWLPALEVFGEGIFIGLNDEKLSRWAQSPFAIGRTQQIAQASAQSVMSEPVDPKRLLLHTVAHALMNELSMEAGYPISSLRERLYSSDRQSGVLIYTATADSAGSLGGLSAQADSVRLGQVLRTAMHRALWCTSDPVCVESFGSGTDNLNLAACHACMLVPETSCEIRNVLLDRALLVGTPEEPEAGFFSELAGR